MRKLLSFSLILGAAVWLIACGSSSKPVVQSQTKSFAFMQEAGSYLFTPMVGKYTTTGNTTTLTIGAVLDPSTNQPVSGEFYSIMLSPDGTKAVVDLYGGQNGDSGQWDIFVTDSSGTGNLVAVTNDAYDDAMPQFSPDGSKVVFTSYRAGGPDGGMDQVVIRNIDGSNEQVPPIPQYVWEMWAPTFSPDGSQIAMEVWGYDANDAEFAGIMVMNVDGSNAQLLTNPYTDCYCWDTTPSYTADGSGITFSRRDQTSLPETDDVYIMNADGSAVTPLTDSVGVNHDPLTITIPGVGERILFSSNRDNLSAALGSGFEIYSMTTDGASLTRITTDSLFDAFSGTFYDYGDAAQARVGAHHTQRHTVPPPHGMKKW